MLPEELEAILEDLEAEQQKRFSEHLRTADTNVSFWTEEELAIISLLDAWHRAKKSN